MGKITPVVFLIVGATWLAAGATSAERTLVWPGLASILSGPSLVVRAMSVLRRPLGVASSLFGLLIAVFQIYIVAQLSSTSLGSLVVYSLVTFVILGIAQVFLLYTAARAQA